MTVCSSYGSPDVDDADDANGSLGLSEGALRAKGTGDAVRELARMDAGVGGRRPSWIEDIATEAGVAGIVNGDASAPGEMGDMIDSRLFETGPGRRLRCLRWRSRMNTITASIINRRPRMPATTSTTGNFRPWWVAFELSPGEVDVGSDVLVVCVVWAGGGAVTPPGLFP